MTDPRKYTSQQLQEIFGATDEDLRDVVMELTDVVTEMVTKHHNFLMRDVLARCFLAGYNFGRNSK